jgi:hypothetical protein
VILPGGQMLALQAPTARPTPRKTPAARHQAPATLATAGLHQAHPQLSGSCRLAHHAKCPALLLAACRAGPAAAREACAATSATTAASTAHKQHRQSPGHRQWLSSSSSSSSSRGLCSALAVTWGRLQQVDQWSMLRSRGEVGALCCVAALMRLLPTAPFWRP